LSLIFTYYFVSQPSDLLLDAGLAPGSLQVLPIDDARVPSAARVDKSAIPVLVSTPQLSNEAAQVLVITPSPLRFDLYSEGTLLLTVNERSLMHFEQSRGPVSTQTEKKAEQSIDKHGGREIVSYGEDGLAVYADGSREEKTEDVDGNEESASVEEGDKFGGHTDTQPLGPMSVGLDFSFPFAEHVYGIPEHTSPLSLPTSAPGSGKEKEIPYYSQPYRLYNLDVFEYELDKTMALYGHIPLMFAHGLVGGTGVTAVRPLSVYLCLFIYLFLCSTAVVVVVVVVVVVAVVVVSYIYYYFYLFLVCLPVFSMTTCF